MRASGAKRRSEPRDALAAEEYIHRHFPYELDRRECVAAICDGVVDVVAALFNVSGRELRHPGRSPHSVTRVRQIAMYVAHVTLHLSMREVGEGFCRDRTTVLHACHQVEDMRDEEEFDCIVAVAERVVRAAFGQADGE